MTRFVEVEAAVPPMVFRIAEKDTRRGARRKFVHGGD